MLSTLLLRGRMLVFFALLSAHSLRGQEFRVSEPESIMPFELRAGFLVLVGGQIGDLGGLKFILDTGASYTVIDSRVADKFHLQRRPGKITNFDRQVDVAWADVPELRIGPLQARGAPVLVAKLADYSDFTEGIDGIIGLDLLGRSKRLLIDYERQRLLWEFAGPAQSGDSVPACIVVPMIVRGARLQLVLDTGLRGILVYKDRLQKNLPELRAKEDAFKVNFGRLQTTPRKLTGVRLLGTETEATVFLIDRPPNGAPPGVDGYLGIATLNAKRIEFNFATNTFRWQ